MKIAIVGATGNLGTPMVVEALGRGHEVTAVSRGGKAVAGAEGFALDVADTRALSALIGRNDVTVFSVPGQENAHRAVIEAQPSGRIIVVGGAGTLRTDDGDLVMNGPHFPAEFLPHSREALRVLDAYRSSDVDWTVICPPSIIAPGERTGAYVEGLDSLSGVRISNEDFAVAVIDEAEQGKHRRERFTVATAD